MLWSGDDVTSTDVTKTSEAPVVPARTGDISAVPEDAGTSQRFYKSFGFFKI